MSDDYDSEGLKEANTEIVNPKKIQRRVAGFLSDSLTELVETEHKKIFSGSTFSRLSAKLNRPEKKLRKIVEEKMDRDPHFKNRPELISAATEMAKEVYKDKIKPHTDEDRTELTYTFNDSKIGDFVENRVNEYFTGSAGLKSARGRFEAITNGGGKIAPQVAGKGFNKRLAGTAALLGGTLAAGVYIGSTIPNCTGADASETHESVADHHIEEDIKTASGGGKLPDYREGLNSSNVVHPMLDGGVNNDAGVPGYNDGAVPDADTAPHDDSGAGAGQGASTGADYNRSDSPQGPGNSTGVAYTENPDSSEPDNTERGPSAAYDSLVDLVGGPEFQSRFPELNVEGGITAQNVINYIADYVQRDDYNGEHLMEIASNLGLNWDELIENRDWVIRPEDVESAQFPEPDPSENEPEPQIENARNQEPENSRGMGLDSNNFSDVLKRVQDYNESRRNAKVSPDTNREIKTLETLVGLAKNETDEVREIYSRMIAETDHPLLHEAYHEALSDELQKLNPLLGVLSRDLDKIEKGMRSIDGISDDQSAALEHIDKLQQDVSTMRRNGDGISPTTRVHLPELCDELEAYKTRVGEAHKNLLMLKQGVSFLFNDCGPSESNAEECYTTFLNTHFGSKQLKNGLTHLNRELVETQFYVKGIEGADEVGVQYNRLLVTVEELTNAVNEIHVPPTPEPNPGHDHPTPEPNPGHVPPTPEPNPESDELDDSSNLGPMTPDEASAVLDLSNMNKNDDSASRSEYYDAYELSTSSVSTSEQEEMRLAGNLDIFDTYHSTGKSIKQIASDNGISAYAVSKALDEHESETGKGYYINGRRAPLVKLQGRDRRIADSYALRCKGFTYSMIGEQNGTSASTARRDVFEVQKLLDSE